MSAEHPAESPPSPQGHGHAHRPGHGHSHARASQRIGWAFFLNLGFTLIEFVGGWLTQSAAIMADAVHDLGDSLAIGSAWLLSAWGDRRADARFTYGYRRLNLLGVLINGLLLLVGSCWVLSTALPRLLDPVMPHTDGMVALAVLGVAVNGYAAWRLREGETLNERMLNWHLLEDLFGWVAVLLVAVLMPWLQWPLLDPLLSIAFTLFIAVQVLKNLRLTLGLFLQGNPDDALLTELRGALLAQPGITGVHQLRLWSLDGEHHVLTTHVTLAAGLTLDDYATLKTRLREVLADYRLRDTTIEMELAEEGCRDGEDARHEQGHPGDADEMPHPARGRTGTAVR